MDNYLNLFDRRIELTHIRKWGDNKQTTTVIPGDLIKVLSKPVPHYSDNWMIVLDKETSCDSEDDSKFEMVDDNVLGYLIVETNLQSRLKVYYNRDKIIPLKTSDIINIYLKSTSGWELKICCTIEYIGEVPEYGKGIYFVLSAPLKFKFPENPQNGFIEKYAMGINKSTIILTSSAFFEHMDFDFITNRSVALKQAPTSSTIDSNSDMEDNQVKRDAYRQRNQTLSLQLTIMPFTCPICRRECSANSGILLVICNHRFCFDCFTSYINESPGNINLCPFINKKYKCNSIFKPNELVNLNLDDNIKFVDSIRTSNHDENTQCLTATSLQCMYCFDNCSRTRIFTMPECNHNVCNNCLIVYLDHSLKEVVDELTCPIKRCEYLLKSSDILEMFIQLDRFYIKNEMNLFNVCATCQVAHSNKPTCKLFQSDLKADTDEAMLRLKDKYQKLLDIGDAGLCPKCKLVIIKQGHQKVYCSNCETIFERKQFKSWQCGNCYNLNEQNSNICEVCGQNFQNKEETKISTAKCLLCTSKVNFSDGMALSCSHFFCTKCLVSLVHYNKSIYKCPYEAKTNKCLTEIDEYELLMIMGVEMYKQFKLDDVPVIQTTQPFYCVYCLTDFEEVGEGIILRGCFHVVCKGCFTKIVHTTEDVDVKCQFIIEEGVKTGIKCDSIIEDREIKAVVDEQLYNQYLIRRCNIGVNTIENNFQCKTVDCIGVWENVGDGTVQECPYCNAANCLKCKAIHIGMKCDEYQTTTKTNKLLEDESMRGITMQCPKCQYNISRDEGCDWIVCTICKTEICWATKGPRWGPNGHGDVTGGCKCYLDGKLCHIDCRGCH